MVTIKVNAKIAHLVKLLIMDSAVIVSTMKLLREMVELVFWNVLLYNAELGFTILNKDNNCNVQTTWLLLFKGAKINALIHNVIVN
jgi:hypothetical protein